MSDELQTHDQNMYTPTIWEAAIEGKEAKPVTLAKLNDEFKLTLPHIKAEELVDKTFVIAGVKEFESAFPTQDHAYFAKCVNREFGEFTTVLGGTAVVEMVDAIIASGSYRPVEVTLRKIVGGKYGGYYTIE